MTARPHTYWQVHCNAPSCGAQDTSPMGESRAQFRKYLAKRGWTVKVGDGPLPLRKDFCPDHNPEPEPSEEAGPPSSLADALRASLTAPMLSRSCLPLSPRRADR